MLEKIWDYALKRNKQVMVICGLCVLVSLVQLPRIKVDTDPENMLPADAPVRVFHRSVKKEFSIYDMVVLGITNEKNPQGVFNVDTLTKIYLITEEIKDIDGVISREVIAPSTKDNIEQGGIGMVKFNWLMAQPPQSEEDALRVKREAQDHPMFKGSVVSADGKALAIYVPIERKDLSYEVAERIRAICRKYLGQEHYYITGLPVANDQFGVEMFKQMAVSAPLAGLVIFLLMWWFFKSLTLILAPMILAVMTVVMTMGLLIGFGFPVHIMSSMIPIFLMPMAVLDSVHILSEFFDQYPRFKDKGKTILFVMRELFSPMLFTSLTSVAGFFSLSFSAIPPVQVFGVFVAIGIVIAWILTMVFVPAYVMLLNEKSFSRFRHPEDEGDRASLMNVLLSGLRRWIFRHARLIVVASVFLTLFSFYGIAKINVNDNPVRWFSAKHPIRVADRVLNAHFAGTYEAYLVLEAKDKGAETFIEPQMLRYVEALQRHMVAGGFVGKATSLVDIVKKVYYELLGGNPENSRVPDSKQAVAQTIISFENSHKPDDLWHMTTPDYSKLNMWVQLRSGDNQDMASVVRDVEHYLKENPPPFEINYAWAGLSYINVIWQDKMVGGMLNNFLGSYIIVLLMMVFLFRSPVNALISMIPLTVTITFIYSLLGFFGKDYDMPVAVLSALTLGLSIDFAIHFIQRATEIHRETGTWERTSEKMFQGPGRAIIRNALVVAIGFLPLLAAPLVPYKTVGFFMFAIMAVSSLATLLILPAIITLMPKKFFEENNGPAGCRCGHCFLTGLFVAAAVAYILSGYTTAGWKATTWVTIGVIAAFAVVCHLVSQRSACVNQRKEGKHA